MRLGVSRFRGLFTYLWLVGNGRVVVIVVILYPIPPFPTNQRSVYGFRLQIFFVDF